MSYTNLVKWAAKQTAFPVRVKAVRDWFIEKKLQEEIYFIKAQIDKNILRGYIKQIHVPNAVYDADPNRASFIYYSDMLNVCWKRFVCCKEMMHVFDSTEEIAGDRESVKKLLSDITSPFDPNDVSDQHISEYLAELRALHVLFPIHARNKFKPFYDSGALSAYEVALSLRIPEYYVPSAMDDKYEAMLPVLK